MIMILTLLKPTGNLLECTELFLIEMCYFKTGNGGEVLSPDKTKSVEVVLDQYNDLIAFKVSASKELEEIRARLDKISETCDRI